jgi:hypothetical protein
MNLRLPSRRAFPCPECGQDLRGQALCASCPKCNTSVLHTFWLARAGKHRAHQMTAFRLQRIWLRAVARSIGSSRSACEFVLDSLAHVPRPGWFAKPAPPDARAICAGIAELSRLIFRDAAEARTMFTHWGIHRSEDVGTILNALCDAGLARAEGIADFNTDFSGLFVTNEWMT